MLNKKFKEIIDDLDENIIDKNDLAYAKTKITEISMLYLDELQNMESSYTQKIKICEEKINNLEKSVERLDKEILQIMEIDEEDTDLEPIKCPYCNTNFFIEFDSSRKEIKCPDCKNVIELDWGNFEDDM